LFCLYFDFQPYFQLLALIQVISHQQETAG